MHIHNILQVSDDSEDINEKEFFGDAIQDIIVCDEEELGGLGKVLFLLCFLSFF